MSVTIGLALLLSLHLDSASTRVTPSGFAARQPQIASAEERVFVVCGQGDRLFTLSSGDGGRSFGAPLALPTVGKLALGMRRGPRVAMSGQNVVVSAIYGKAGGGKDGELLAWRSSDEGKSWRGPSTVSDVPGAAREGLHAMASSSGGLLACAWLDLRAEGTEIWLSTSSDAGATWSKNVRVYRSPSGTVCECCHPSVAFSPDGVLHVMFRNSLEGARDMYLSTSRDGGKTFAPARKLGDGTWKLNACPMDGGALAVGTDGTIETVWRRGGKVFLSVPGEPERELGDGGQPWIAPGVPGAKTVWQTREGRIRTASRGAVEELSSGRDPAVARVGSGALVVWEEDSAVWAKSLP